MAEDFLKNPLSLFDIKGKAALIIEQGRATAAALEEIAGTWRSVGPAARNVFLMQKLDALTRIVMSSVSKLKVDRLTVLGGVGGNGATGTVGNLIAASEQIKAATGVDLAAAVGTRLGAPPKPPAG